MSDLAELEQRFLGFLTGTSPEAPLRELVADQGGIPPEVRLAIYRNAYRLRLRETIDTDHEILGRYLGDELFETLVDGYVAAHPSRHRSLRDFTRELPGYLRRSEPFSDHPMLAELAAFERLLLEVFDARDADRVDLAELMALAPEAWPGMRLRFHPSVQQFRADWNSVEIWAALKAETPPPDAVRQSVSHWLLWRGRDRLSQFRPLAFLEQKLLDLALRGANFACLCEAAGVEIAESEVSGTMLGMLSDWIGAGLIRRLET